MPIYHVMVIFICLIDHHCEDITASEQEEEVDLVVISWDNPLRHMPFGGSKK
jgi:hypothetical protein